MRSISYAIITASLIFVTAYQFVGVQQLFAQHDPPTDIIPLYDHTDRKSLNLFNVQVGNTKLHFYGTYDNAVAKTVEKQCGEIPISSFRYDLKDPFNNTLYLFSPYRFSKNDHYNWLNTGILTEEDLKSGVFTVSSYIIGSYLTTQLRQLILKACNVKEISVDGKTRFLKLEDAYNCLGNRSPLLHYLYIEDENKVSDENIKNAFRQWFSICDENADRLKNKEVSPLELYLSCPEIRDPKQWKDLDVNIRSGGLKFHNVYRMFILESGLFVEENGRNPGYGYKHNGVVIYPYEDEIAQTIYGLPFHIHEDEIVGTEAWTSATRIRMREEILSSPNRSEEANEKYRRLLEKYPNRADFPDSNQIQSNPVKRSDKELLAPFYGDYEDSLPISRLQLSCDDESYDAYMNALAQKGLFPDITKLLRNPSSHSPNPNVISMIETRGTRPLLPWILAERRLEGLGAYKNHDLSYVRFVPEYVITRFPNNTSQNPIERNVWKQNKTDFLKGYDFTAFDLTGAVFDGLDLTDVDFTAAIVTRASFKNTTGLTLDQLKKTWNWQSGHMRTVELPDELHKELENESANAP